MSEKFAIGVGLWGLQSAWSAPAHLGSRYDDILGDARLLHELRFNSIWLTEHRLWYDGYAPSPLLVAAMIGAHVPELRIGTSVMLLPQHDPIRVAQRVASVDQLIGGRLELGVGNGYRDVEFDALGIRRDQRGARSTEAISLMRFLWGQSPRSNSADTHFLWPEVPLDLRPTQEPMPVWIGAMSDPPIRRAARLGAHLILPGSWSPARVQAARALYEDVAAARGVDITGRRTAIIRFVWVDATTSEAERTAVPALTSLLRDQYTGMAQMESAGAGAGRVSGDEPTAAPDPRSQMTVGDPDQVAQEIDAYRAAGIDLFIARLQHPYIQRPQLHEALRMLAADVMGRLGSHK